MNTRPQHGDAPLSVTHDPGKREMLVLAACALISLAVAAIFTYRLVAVERGPYDDPSGEIGLLIASCIGVLVLGGWALLVGLRRNKTKRVYRVEGGEVVCADGKGPLWREAITAYRAARWHEEERSYATKSGRRYYTVQVLTLDHEQPERCFEILAHQETGQIEAACARWSKGLGLPVVRAEAGQEVERSAEEIAKPLAELAAEGRLGSRFDESAPLPAGVAWGREGDGVWVRLRPTRYLSFVLAPIFILLGLGLAFASWQEFGEAGEIPLFFVQIGVALILATLAFRQEVKVSAMAVDAEYRLLGWTFLRRRLAPDAIVRIRRTRWPMCDGLYLEGQGAKITLGLLDREPAQWLEGFLQSAILKQAARS
ncbi:MAG: hypothetical protein AAF495_01920 [Pseudomonadota bacterium]